MIPSDGNRGKSSGRRDDVPNFFGKNVRLLGVLVV